VRIWRCHRCEPAPLCSRLTAQVCSSHMGSGAGAAFEDALLAMSMKPARRCAVYRAIASW
jgi:hypothetical protein